MTADRDTTLTPEIERALHNLVHDRRGTTTWNAARIIIAAALREARVNGIEEAARFVTDTYQRDFAEPWRDHLSGCLRVLASPGSAPVAPARDAERSGRLAAEERADALAEHVSDLVRYIGRVDQVSPADDLRSDECLDEWDDLRATVEEARRALAPVAPEEARDGR
jgi:hypothetical protein